MEGRDSRTHPFSSSCSWQFVPSKTLMKYFQISEILHQGIADKILVMGFEKDESHHNAALETVCACANEVNLSLNDNKCI